MQVRPRRHPVQRRHVLVTFALLTLVTCAVMAPITAPQERGFKHIAEHVVVSVLVAAALFMPALRHSCTLRGSWIVLRRAERSLRDLGLCVSLLFMIALIALPHIGADPADPARFLFDRCFEGAADGMTLYCWALVMLPALHGVVRVDAALQKWRQP